MACYARQSSLGHTSRGVPGQHVGRCVWFAVRVVPRPCAVIILKPRPSCVQDEQNPVPLLYASTTGLHLLPVSDALQKGITERTMVCALPARNVFHVCVCGVLSVPGCFALLLHGGMHATYLER